MTDEKYQALDAHEHGFLRGWRFGSLFSWSKPAEKEKNLSPLQQELREKYPQNADEIINFLANILSRRQAIVEKLGKHPELNDHGFFMVICKLYMDTYHGIGHTNSRLTHLIELFSTAEISRGTAARKLSKANDVGVFKTESDIKDNRKQRYYLHPEMIEICSEVFGGMIDDVVSSHSNIAKPESVDSDETAA